MTDALLIGGGHNGLVCAFYLARAGLDVTVLERRNVVGGAAVTEEFHPGFRNSAASYTVSLLNNQVIDDLDLYARGLKIVERAQPNFWPLGTAPGEYLQNSYDLETTQKEFARYSQNDADALPGYYAALEMAANVLRRLVLETPPNAGGGLHDAWRLVRTGNHFRKLSLADQQIMLDLFTKSASEFLRQWFEHPAIIGAFAFDGVVGNYASPHAAGTAYVLLHHVFGDIEGRSGFWGHAIGGMGAITQAMAKAAGTHGVAIRTDAAVEDVLLDEEKAIGVRLDNGEEIYANAIISNINPKKLMGELVQYDAINAEHADYRDRMENYACGSATFRMNVALSELPDFSCLPGKTAGDHHKSGIIIGPSVDYLDRAYLDARQSGWSKSPVIEMLIPSTIDDTLAPTGQHVASLFCQHFAPELPNGRSWDEARKDAAETIIDTVTRFAPNFKGSIIARQIHSPLDLERKFGLTGGDIFHGRLSLDQMFSARPTLGYADYRTPIKGLYLCGSGAHPGGGVTGAPGHNAAREILQDFRRR